MLGEKRVLLLMPEPEWDQKLLVCLIVFLDVLVRGSRETWRNLAGDQSALLEDLRQT